MPPEDGDVLQVGSVPIEVLHTPGHTPDSICLLVGGKKLLIGDTMFVGKIPAVPSGSGESQARAFYDSIRRLMRLDDDVEVWPGHDVGRSSSSTIRRERRENSVAKMTFQEFWKERRYDRELDAWVVPCRPRRHK